MTVATAELLEEIYTLLLSEKYIMIQGGIATGKTFLASKLIVDRATENGSIKVNCETVSVHPSFSYSDFVYGIGMQTDNKGNIDFKFTDKIFLEMLSKANQSFAAGNNERFILILDDINRGMISEMLGDILSLIEPHGESTYSISINNSTITIPPNFFIIATQNTTISKLEPTSISFLRRFSTVNLQSNFAYMSDSDNPVLTSNLDVSPNAMYYRTKRIVTDHLCAKYRANPSNFNRFILGHGLFSSEQISLRMTHNVIPLLKQYVKDGILEKSAERDIAFIEQLLNSSYSKDPAYRQDNRITGIDPTRITATEYLSHSENHFSVVYLIARIKQQGLLDDNDILDSILFNSNVIYRLKNSVGTWYPQPGYLYVKQTLIAPYRLPGGRALYKTLKKDGYRLSPKIDIDKETYCVTGEIQDTERIAWSDIYLDDNYENERPGSTSPYLILFLIIKNYCRRLLYNYDRYLEAWPQDQNIYSLRMLIRQQFDGFIQGVKGIHSTGANASNKAANNAVKNLVSQLSFLWADIGDTITFAGQNIIVEGVYKVEKSEKCKEYYSAMENLGIHQMILQGPPGTSKTHSSQALLRFVAAGVDNDAFCTKNELESFQIKNYENGSENSFSDYLIANPGQPVPLAWDVVQFHPSYGYEDFVRGIDVSTIEDPTTNKTSIVYKTINKILGRMAELASLPQYSDTKFFLVIDEINRANLATVFGELIYGLEYRTEKISTPYTIGNDNKISLPNNLYILGTMNTADKSIGGIDYAIRRRFLFFSLLPDTTIIEKYRLDILTDPTEIDEQINVNNAALQLFNQVSTLFDNLNPEYFKEDVQIGHTYFLVESLDQLYLRFKYQIIPILREYDKDGMFQLEDQDTGDALDGLLKCISGRLDTSDDLKLHSLYDGLCGINATDSGEEELEPTP